jgi:flavin reductase (DIM6/NTAB) family NADH-FMN oxidoreductase RutF
LIRIREQLETGPIVLVTSRHKRRSNIMTMGWHTMPDFKPALFGCYIWDGKPQLKAIRASGECVINVPTADLVDKIVQIGNSHANDGDKFEATGWRRETAPLPFSRTLWTDAQAA